MTGRFIVRSFSTVEGAEEWLNTTDLNDYELTKFTVRSHGSGIMCAVVLECVKRDMGPDVVDDLTARDYGYSAVEGEVLL